MAKRRPPEEHTTRGLLARLFELEAEIRAVPAERRDAAVALVVARMARLRSKRGEVAGEVDQRQLTLDKGTGER